MYKNQKLGEYAACDTSAPTQRLPPTTQLSRYSPWLLTLLLTAPLLAASASGLEAEDPGSKAATSAAAAPAPVTAALDGDEDGDEEEGGQTNTARAAWPNTPKTEASRDGTPPVAIEPESFSPADDTTQEESEAAPLPKFVPLRPDMGYQQAEGPDGTDLVYEPAWDQTLPHPRQPDTATWDYLEIQRQQALALFNYFLATQLTPTQHALLRDQLAAHFQPLTNNDTMDNADKRAATGLRSPAAAMETLTAITLALYYYSLYIQDPLMEFADHTTQSGAEGVLALRIIAMNHYILSQFPRVQPLVNMAQQAAGAAYLFYRYYAEGRTSMALATSSYAILLALASQFSAKLLLKHTTFNGHAAGMLSTAWHHWQNRYYQHAVVDSLLALHFNKNKNALFYTTLAAILTAAVQIPPPDVPGARFWNANHLMPVIMASCLTEEWLSAAITAATLLLNQHLLYAPRAFFLEPGSLYTENEPWVLGLAGAAVIGLATLFISWDDLPGLPSLSAQWRKLTRSLPGMPNLLPQSASPQQPSSTSAHYSSPVAALTRWYARLFSRNSAYTGEPPITDLPAATAPGSSQAWAAEPTLESNLEQNTPQ
ncbi:MAG: hypothetical protein OXC07_10505 [Kistimonas sp.]|nr:hypothetical protein [Kistimonas sp.]